VYIFTGPGLASRRWCPLSSNVRRHPVSHYLPWHSAGICARTPPMYSIESVNTKGWKWISGVFLDPIAAEVEARRIPAVTHVSHEVIQTQIDRFPIFVIEDKGFSYVSLPELLTRLDTLVPKQEEDHVHFNVYALRSPFKPEMPGRDEMGGILHWHVTDWETREPRASVFRAELNEFASDA
jgi:hypothetical protein